MAAGCEHGRGQREFAVVEHGEAGRAQMLRHGGVGRLTGGDAVPEDPGELGRGPGGVLCRAAQEPPGRLGQLDEEGPAALTGEDGEAVRERPPVVRLAPVPR